MPGPTIDALLAAWERGWAEPENASRVLALLGATVPEISAVSLADISIGERDALLLRLQEQLFGQSFHALAVCPRCKQRVELSFDASEVFEPRYSTVNEPLSLSWEEYQVQFRLPTTSDLLAVKEPTEIGRKRIMLLRRLVLHAERAGRSIAHEELPEELISRIEAAMHASDPHAEINLKLFCASCQHEWNAFLDIGSFLWKQIDAWAVRLLRDVHQLASAYGWREADILAMSAWRRHAYLEILGT
jgi:hypothetical protein